MSTLATLYKRPAYTIRPDHLSHVIGEGNYSTIHFTDGSKVVFTLTLKVFEAQYPFLIRISKSFAANPASITGWERIDSKTMHVTVGDVQYSVSRRRIDDVLGRLRALRLNS